jgi:flagellar basal-body rod modification protein FlgD
MPNPVSGPATGLTPTPDQIDRTDASGAWGQDTFLKLLMAEMQHQDPLQPTDSAAMMTQMAQFSAVEGLNKLNTQLTALNIQQDFASAVTMIGKTVTWLDEQGATHTGAVQAVKPSPTGAILTIDGSDVPSGEVKEVQ